MNSKAFNSNQVRKNYSFVPYIHEAHSVPDPVGRLRPIDTLLKEVALGHSYIKPDVTEAEIRTILEKRRIFIVDAPVVCPEAMLPQYNGLYR